MNRQCGTISGRPVDELIGKLVWDEFPELDKSGFGQALHQAEQTGQVQRVEEFYPPLNRWIPRQHVSLLRRSFGVCAGCE